VRAAIAERTFLVVVGFAIATPVVYTQVEVAFVFLARRVNTSLAGGVNHRTGWMTYQKA